MKILSSKKLIMLIAIITCFFMWKIIFINYQSQFQNQNVYALLGDVGGTNIRLQLVVFKLQDNFHYSEIKIQRMKVKNFTTFTQAIETFLRGIEKQFYPSIAVIGMAGPIANNSLYLSNVPQWGKIQGKKIGQQLGISNFRLINDFQAISYGILIVPETQMISLNGKSIDLMKLRGVIGPGTGLGHSILFNNKNTQQSIIILPSQAGHTDFPLIDDQTVEYFNFLKKEKNLKYISLQKSFCGPAIPYIHKFYFKKYYPQQLYQEQTSQYIFQEALKENCSLTFKKTVEFFLKMYSTAIGNFLVQHICEGGIYLVGSVTKAILPLLKKVDILKQWKQRHPQIAQIIDKIPIVFCNQVDLGLKGAFVVATKIYRSSLNLETKQSISHYKDQL